MKFRLRRTRDVVQVGSAVQEPINAVTRKLSPPRAVDSRPSSSRLSRSETDASSPFNFSSAPKRSPQCAGRLATTRPNRTLPRLRSARRSCPHFPQSLSLDFPITPVPSPSSATRRYRQTCTASQPLQRHLPHSARGARERRHRPPRPRIRPPRTPSHPFQFRVPLQRTLSLSLRLHVRPG